MSLVPGSKTRKGLGVLAVLMLGCSDRNTALTPTELVDPTEPQAAAQTGQLQVTIKTVGTVPSGTYTLAIAGVTRAVQPNDVVTFSNLEAGQYELAIELPPSCVFSGVNPRRLQILANKMSAEEIALSCGERVAFVRTVGGQKSTVVVMAPDGSAILPVTQSYPQIDGLSWRVGARSFTYTTNGDFGGAMIRNLDGTGLRLLVLGGRLWPVTAQPDLLADGVTAVFVAIRFDMDSGTTEIARADVGSTQAAWQLTHSGGALEKAAPKWSPDQTRIAYTTSSGGGHGVPRLHVMNADGSGDRDVVEGWDPAWSPDGKAIAFSTAEGIFIISADGSGIRMLAGHESAALSAGAEAGLSSSHPARLQGGWPTWSPDGSKLAYSSWVGGKSKIFVVNADGSEPRKISETDGADSFLAWSH